MLCFVGAKMVAGRLVEIPIVVSLGVVAALLGGAIAASLLWRRPPAAPSLARREEG